MRRTALRALGASCASRRRRGTGARRRRGLASPRRAQGRTNDRREQNNSHTKPRGVPARLRRREPPDRTIRNEIARAGPSGRSTGSEDCEVRLGRFCPGARAGFGGFEGGREGDRARARVAVCICYETRRKDAPRAVPGSDFQRGRTTERPAPNRADLSFSRRSASIRAKFGASIVLPTRGSRWCHSETRAGSVRPDRSRSSE